MKRILAICLAVFISVSVSAGAEIYIEKFISSERAHLSNLTVVPSMGLAILGFGEDIPGFGLKDSTARFGEIRYQVRGASQVTIKFYSANSSFACPASNNQWRLGMPSPDYNGEMLPVYMDPTGALYIHDGVTWYQHQLPKKDAEPWVKSTFNPVSWAPESTIPLNMNVSVTDSSGHTKALSGSSTKPYPKVNFAQTIIGYCEERTYTIPDNARELVIELNYPWDNRDASGNPTGEEVKLTSYPVVVTQIQIEGEHLIFDQKDPDPEESSSGSGSTGGGDEDHSDDEIILPDNDPESTQEDRVEMPVSSEESSSQSSGSSEGKSSSSRSSSGSKKSSSGSKQPEEPDRTSSEPESETLIYQTDKDSVRDKLFYLMLAGYGVIGLGIAWQIYRHTIRRK